MNGNFRAEVGRVILLGAISYCALLTLILAMGTYCHYEVSQPIRDTGFTTKAGKKLRRPQVVQRTPKHLALLLLLSLTLACATPSPPPSPKATPYKTLKTLHYAYSNTFNALGEAYKQGRLLTHSGIRPWPMAGTA